MSSHPTTPAFPVNFLWGAATASYQIEGAVNEDGRGESIWDRFSAMPGKVRNGETGAVACDHYHRYTDDIGLMRELGLGAYRFSIAWPRILPEGMGRIEPRGLDFYDRLVDRLLEAGIIPFATLYHWDLPQVLEDRGGWPSRDTVDAYIEYVAVVTRHLGDRVKNWITHNEPQVQAWAGYGSGEHAPGRTSRRDAIASIHHLLLSHGRAVPVIRRESPGSQVGITLNLSPVYAASSSVEDEEAARTADGSQNRWFLDPIFRGSYPGDVAQGRYRDLLPRIDPDDMAAIATPIDFLGINNYSRTVVRHDPSSIHPRSVHPDDSHYTAMGWDVYPPSFHDLLVRVHRDYAPPRIYITENGAAYEDLRDHLGAVNDPERRQYIHDYLAAERAAIEEGVPVAGHFVWSLLDNFEWHQGYVKRFGLVYIDYPTLERVPKASYYWYRDFIASQP